jgi:hypothetical protein
VVNRGEVEKGRYSCSNTQANLSLMVVKHPAIIRRKVKDMEPATNQSQGDRERSLWIASQKYLTGAIDISELEEIESSYTEDFNNAMIIISKRNVSHELFHKMLKFCKLKC